MRSDERGRSRILDSPAVSARARARIPVTDSEINRGDRVRQAFTSWWLLTAEPMTLRELWNASKVDRKRIPADNLILRVLWQVSNWTDRLAMFAAVTIVFPPLLTGPLRWCAARPTRRYGLYLTVAALTGAYLYERNH
ncbi:hypothetical protein ACIA5D_36470 [Actinoplanes sp. NPDC051513]|uniref:hypothetical protein n=1 Tax=Actinoplanes sp. NPDC051513 TaxID=3363908 RepID=UPI0037A49548